MNLFDLLNLLAGNIWTYGLPFILVLSILVFVHEWGHYVVARLCGVRVETFSIGFGKEIFGFTDKAGTRWKFSLVPLGGYVKMYGDTDPASAGHSEEEGEGDQRRPMTEAERKQAFFAKPLWQRSAIVFAGPAINFLFAILLFIGLYFFIGKPVTPPVATAIIAGSAAEEAGIKPHDRIISINGNKVDRFEQIRRAVMISVGEEMNIKIRRRGDEVQLSASPDIQQREDRFGFKNAYGFLGIIGPNNGLNLASIQEIDGIATQGDLTKNAQLISGRFGQDIRVKLDERGDPQTLFVNVKEEMNDELLSHAAAATSAKSTGTLRGDDIQKERKKDVSRSAEKSSLHESGVTKGGIDGKSYNQEKAAPVILYISSAETVSATSLAPLGLLQSVGSAINETWEVTVGTVQALGQIITGARSATELGGIIRIGAIAGDMAQAGLIALIGFSAVLSINLGLINLFPVPMLDGGHLLFYGLEAVKGSPISEQVQEYAFRVGLVILVGIMLFANLNDIVQLIS